MCKSQVIGMSRILDPTKVALKSESMPGNIKSRRQAAHFGLILSALTDEYGF